MPEYRVWENKQFKSTKNERDILQHERRFVAEAWLNEELLGKGYGRSKKASEQAAAKSAFLLVREQESQT